jgi:hypothetical protein
LHRHDRGVSFLAKMAGVLALRKRGESGKRLAEVHAAGLFLYDSGGVGVEVADLLNEPLAINIAQLRERSERLPAVHDADWETIGIGLRRRCGRRKELVLVVLGE